MFVKLMMTFFTTTTLSSLSILWDVATNSKKSAHQKKKMISTSMKRRKTKAKTNILRDPWSWWLPPRNPWQTFEYQRSYPLGNPRQHDRTRSWVQVPLSKEWWEKKRLLKKNKKKKKKKKEQTRFRSKCLSCVSFEILTSKSPSEASFTSSVALAGPSIAWDSFEGFEERFFYSFLFLLLLLNLR